MIKEEEAGPVPSLSSFTRPPLGPPWVPKPRQHAVETVLVSAAGPPLETVALLPEEKFIFRSGGGGVSRRREVKQLS